MKPLVPAAAPNALTIIVAIGSQPVRASDTSVLKQKAAEQAALVHNYDHLSDSLRTYLYSRAYYWLQRIDSLSEQDSLHRLPDDYLDIFTGVVHQTSHPREVNIIEGYNIAYIPQIDMLYLIYLKQYEAVLKYGEDAPIAEVAMGILCQETYFLWVKGDGGLSEAPCQLHRATAAWLLQADRYKDVFSKFIYFDGPDQTGAHHFFSMEAMVEFMYEFLVLAKGYEAGKELSAIARYNGCRIDAPYVINVRSKVVRYLAFKESYLNSFTGNTLADEELVQKIMAVALAAFHQDFDTNYEMEQIVYYAVNNRQLSFASARTRGQTTAGPDKAGIRLQSDINQYTSPDLGFGRPYIMKEKDVSLFAYFRESLDTMVFYHNSVVSSMYGTTPSFGQTDTDTAYIYLYYLETQAQTGLAQKYFIRTTSEYKQASAKHTVYCSKQLGKVFIIPGYPIYYYQNTVSDNYVPACFIDSQ